MTTRVGRMPPEGNGDAFDAALDTLEALAEAEVEAGAAQAELRKLAATWPPHIKADQLTRLFAICCRLIGAIGGVRVAAGADAAQAVRSIGWICEDLLQRALHDERRDTRRSIEQSVDHARVLHPDDVGTRTLHYRPRPHVPVHRDAAARMLAPYLDWLDARSRDEPLAYLPLAWRAVTCPLPPFEGLVWDWLDRSGLGDDMRLALSLHSLRERGQQRVRWQELEHRLVPMLGSSNPVVIAHAAAFIGSLFGDADERLMGPGAWDGARILAHVAALPRHRRLAAGAFLNGIDAMDPDPFAELSRIAPDLDIGDWVMTVLEDHSAEPYIPDCQAFWFYLHERYDRDPDMCLRFVEAGHCDVAWMCITENHPPAEGMDRVLARMAEGAQGAYANAAQRLLDTLREPPTS